MAHHLGWYTHPKTRGVSGWRLARMIRATRKVADDRAARLAEHLGRHGRHWTCPVACYRVDHLRLWEAHRRLLVLWAERQRRIELGRYWPDQEDYEDTVRFPDG